MLKLDMAKAFDSTSWPFLIQIWRHSGFDPRLIARIVALISTANTMVLLNGGIGYKFWHAGDKFWYASIEASPCHEIRVLRTSNGGSSLCSIEELAS
jgi:hypothetical protein